MTVPVPCGVATRRGVRHELLVAQLWATCSSRVLLCFRRVKRVSSALLEFSQCVDEHGFSL